MGFTDARTVHKRKLKLGNRKTTGGLSLFLLVDENRYKPVFLIQILSSDIELARLFSGIDV